MRSNPKETRVDTAAMVGRAKRGLLSEVQSDHQGVNHHAVHLCGCDQSGCFDDDLSAVERSYQCPGEQ
jgi:hypothetical protein